MSLELRSKVWAVGTYLSGVCIQAVIEGVGREEIAYGMRRKEPSLNLLSFLCVFLKIRLNYIAFN